MWNHLLTALSFLTILPLPASALQRTATDDLAASFSYFPLTGLLLGTCCATAAYLLSSWFPFWLLAVSVTSLLVIFSRGLHLDGLADLADGVGGGYTRERRLQIMKDSNIGTFGAIALSLTLLFKVTALHSILLAGHWASIALIPALSRFAMVAAAYKSPYARAEGGLGKPFLENMTSSQLAAAFFFSAAFAILITPRFAPYYALTVLACVALLRRLSQRWLGGVTGDVLGALNEITEVALFTVTACLLQP